MNISAIEIEIPRAENVKVTEDTLTVDLSHPYFPDKSVSQDNLLPLV
jgi:hypothetical protein